MTLDLTKKVEVNNTTYFECLYRNLRHTLVDPVSPGWRILNAKGDAVASGTPSKKSTGIYYFFWTPTKPGDFVAEFTGTIDTDAVLIRENFIVTRTSLDGGWSSSSSCSSS